MSAEQSRSQPDEERVHHGKLTKVERYKWVDPGPRGVQMDIDKDDLSVPEWQRDYNDAKSIRIAGEMSWASFGVISVVRYRGKYLIIDGQHRWRAAKKRADVRTVPCIVYDLPDGDAAARAYVQLNCERWPMRMTDRFRALLVVGDPAALAVKDLLDSCGWSVSGTAHVKTVKCVGALLKIQRRDPTRLPALWPLYLRVFSDMPAHETIVTGLDALETRRAENEASVWSRRWADRIAGCGYAKLMEGINAARAYYSRGGPNVYADGIKRVIDKGLGEDRRFKLRDE